MHRSDAGAVRAGLHGARTVAREARGDGDAPARRRPRARPASSCRRWRRPGSRCSSGVATDPSFGPVVAVAAGGIATELLGDSAVRLTPLTDRDARAMVRELRTFPLLDGFRGAEPADVGALEETLLRLSALVEAHHEIAEMECNPLIVSPAGVMAVDVRVRVEQPRAAPPGAVAAQCLVPAVDLHCHILCGVDDGPRTMAESVIMGRQAAGHGIATVCATPHIRADHDVAIDALAGRVDGLNAALAAHGVSTRVVTGGEVAEEIVGELTAAELAQVSLGGGGRWILLEPRPGPLGAGLHRAIATLAGHGMRSVVAHPERHAGADVADQLAAAVAAGALVQVTAALVAEGPAAPAILDLAAAGLVHLVGSDAHHPRVGRSMDLAPGLERLAAVPLLAAHMRWMAQDAPAAILRGEDVAPPYGPRP